MPSVQWEATVEPPSLAAPSPQLLDVEAARRRLGVGLTKFYDILGRGELCTVKIGSRRLVSEAAIADYIRRLESSHRSPRAGETAA